MLKPPIFMRRWAKHSFEITNATTEPLQIQLAMGQKKKTPLGNHNFLLSSCFSELTPTVRYFSLGYSQTQKGKQPTKKTGKKKKNTGRARTLESHCTAWKRQDLVGDDGLCAFRVGQGLWPGHSARTLRGWEVDLPGVFFCWGGSFFFKNLGEDRKVMVFVECFLFFLGYLQENLDVVCICWYWWFLYTFRKPLR